MKMKILDNLQRDELIEKYCYCPHAIRGRPLDDDFPLFEYTCNLKNMILNENLLIPDWCPLEDYEDYGGIE